MKLTRILPILFLFLFSFSAQAQDHSIAREWNELLLESIRNDFARPTVHARNLFHVSAGMFDAWAAYDDEATPFFLGKTVDGFTVPFDGVPMPADIEAARKEAISFAAYRILRDRFQSSPGGTTVLPMYNLYMNSLGYNVFDTSTDYQSGSPAALGNYIAEQVIAFGSQDQSYQQLGYPNLYYNPANAPLIPILPGNTSMQDPNKWQPLTLDVFIDQSGQVFTISTPEFLSPEWGSVSPFALGPDDLTAYKSPEVEWQVFHDPGTPPMLDTITGGDPSENYKWGFSLVSIWSSHLDPADGVMWDISPGSLGNIQDYPETFDGHQAFYNQIDGGDPSIGHTMNPVTGMPYEPNIVPRGDYTRVLAEFWADGPDSETPPGHWFSIMNYVSDHPLFEKRFKGEGEILDDLEWDIKSYFIMGGTMHDAAISAWGVKGWYDYPRPISAIRYMADLGQSTDPALPNYHHAGIPLEPGYIELVEMGDALAGNMNENVGKIKVYAWKGPDFISNPATDVAGVGWILAEDWWPYQRPTFVTPPFAGYVSGHSTYSRAAADVMEQLTGDAFFPGGMGEFEVVANDFLVFEEGPSTSFNLQWATYRDASDQTSLSRIWGGIHPPADDIPGRLMGIEIAVDAFEKAESYFFIDADGDGFYEYEDCNDELAIVNPEATEICDGLDNDCDGEIDEDLPLFTYYEDTDSDTFGDAGSFLELCQDFAPMGYVTNGDDCDDTRDFIYPGAPELCDDFDNDCNGIWNDGIELFTYYLDNDADGYGDAAMPLDTCINNLTWIYSTNDLDCDDTNANINPAQTEVCDGVDNNCDGSIDEGLELFTYYLDSDQDGYGDAAFAKDTCQATPIEGYVVNDLDCNDLDGAINPDAFDEPDNGVDEDCSGLDYFRATKVFPNPFDEEITIRYEIFGGARAYMIGADGKLAQEYKLEFTDNQADINTSNLPRGVYLLKVVDEAGNELLATKLLKF